MSNELAVTFPCLRSPHPDLLAGEDRHVRIMQEGANPDARLQLGPGTLRCLQRLLTRALSRRSWKGEEDSRRRYYRLTSLGSGRERGDWPTRRCSSGESSPEVGEVEIRRRSLYLLLRSSGRLGSNTKIRCYGFDEW
jgi:hypothetical protein